MSEIEATQEEAERLNNNIMIARVKNSRLQLQMLVDGMDEGHFGVGREISLAKTELQSVRHWLGEHLSVLGAENPYPNGNNPDNLIVDPKADMPPKTDACSGAPMNAPTETQPEVAV